MILKVNDRLALKIQLRVGSVVKSHGRCYAGSLRHTPEIATSIDGRFVENLPLNGRSLQPWIWLSPGTVLTKSIFAEHTV